MDSGEIFYSRVTVIFVVKFVDSVKWAHQWRDRGHFITALTDTVMSVQLALYLICNQACPVRFCFDFLPGAIRVSFHITAG